MPTKLVENAQKKENKDYYAVSEGVDVIYLEGQRKRERRPSCLAQLGKWIIYAQNIASV